MTTRKSLSYAKRREIDLYLGTVLKKFGEGLCEYIGGESDQTVAAKFDCTPNNVSGVREAVYGRLRPPVVRSPLEDRIEALETKVSALEERLYGAALMIDRLVEVVRKDHRMPAVQPSLDLKAAE